MKIANLPTAEVSVTVAPDSGVSNANSLAWNDVVIYQEMADNTSVRMNFIQHIQNQMAQLQEMTARRQFLTKEIMAYIVK